MKFLHLHLFHKEVGFGNIQGYSDIKDLVRRALSSQENYRSTGQRKSIILVWNIGLKNNLHNLERFNKINKLS